jgi:ATPase subunit of ABC transporter with duplicated ATPase domains
MYRVDKFYGPQRQVLADISLSFFFGAKIGVLGPNGAGKSTLLRIMSGREESSRGEAALAPGATVGLLEQEPQLDAGKDVRGNVEDGVRELRDLLDRFQDVSARFAEPDADFDALLAEQAKVQEQIDRLATRRFLASGHDPQQGRLPGAVRPEHADLRTVKERERDVRQHLPLWAVELVDPVHRIHVLAHKGPR